MSYKHLSQTISETVGHQILFASIGGSHLYGFNSKDSDLDIRGCFVYPLEKVVGLKQPRETIDFNLTVRNTPLDYELHDLKKFCHLLCKHNANQIEQLYSPHELITSPEHKILQDIAKGCFTSTMFYHFTNFARNEWQDFIKGRKQVKKLLYLYRLMMSGIHLMQTGILIPNINELNNIFHLTYVDDLVKIKMYGKRICELYKPDVEFHKGEYKRLLEIFEMEMNRSKLPRDVPQKTKDELNAFVINTRMKNVLSNISK